MLYLCKMLAYNKISVKKYLERPSLGLRIRCRHKLKFSSKLERGTFFFPRILFYKYISGLRFGGYVRTHIIQVGKITRCLKMYILPKNSPALSCDDNRRPEHALTGYTFGSTKQSRSGMRSFSRRWCKGIESICTYPCNVSGKTKEFLKVEIFSFLYFFFYNSSIINNSNNYTTD
jgi:hypothetical protein